MRFEREVGNCYSTSMLQPAGWTMQCERIIVTRPRKNLMRSCHAILLRDLLNDSPVTVPAIQRLVSYYKALPEFSNRGWNERRAHVLGNDFAGFHSTLVEISLHQALSTIGGISVRFIDPEPGGRRRADYEIRFGGAVFEAEFKSILSEQVRLPNGTHFGGINIDPVTARAVWRQFTEPIREGQVDASRPCAIFVDISVCDELYMFLALPRVIRWSELRDHASSLFDQLAAARREAVPVNLMFVVCGFEPSTYLPLFLAPLLSGESAS
jgi:hypothetical protein